VSTEESVELAETEPVETAEEETPIVYGRFDEDELTDSILAEMAIQSGDNVQALEIYTRLARENGNISFIQRGMRLATFLRNTPRALELGELWLEQEPESVELRQMLALQLVLSSRYAEALDHMTWLLEQDEEIDFRLVPSRLAEDPAAPLLLEAMIDSFRDLAERFPEDRKS